MNYIRNFSIIAHIDHGKSTLADRLLEITGTLNPKRAQVLDDMDLEREKGITIKAHPVAMSYQREGNTYNLNLIDTPGHADFAYEVSRALSACEGALLVVDASQGVQAQTLATLTLAREKGLEIIPILNKIDLPSADIGKSERQLASLQLPKPILCSAKQGEGLQLVLEAIVKQIPPPAVERERLSALIFDSHYDPYQGVVIHLRLMSGTLAAGKQVQLMSTKGISAIQEVGIFTPQRKKTLNLSAGEVGYALANIKDPAAVRVGDTITCANHPTKEPLPGFKLLQPVVYAAIYPSNSSDFVLLRDALGKLQLNDPALTLTGQSTPALGMGFRIGCLGLLHLEIILSRLEREHTLELITTAPSVRYRYQLRNGEVRDVDHAAQAPNPSLVERIEEPWIRALLIIPQDMLGAVIQLSQGKRGILQGTEGLDSDRLLLTYEFPLGEILTNFSNQLKAATKGYASFDYQLSDYHPSDIVRLDIHLNFSICEPFSLLIHRSQAEMRGRALCQSLLKILPRQQFPLPIQAAIGGRVIARETLAPLGKDVTAKCYGGDITRKRKLWDKQKKGKKKLQSLSQISIPSKAMLELLRMD